MSSCALRFVTGPGYRRVVSLNSELRARVFRWTLLLWSCLFGCIVVGVAIDRRDIVHGVLAGFEVLLPAMIVGAGVLAAAAAIQRSVRRNLSCLHRR